MALNSKKTKAKPTETSPPSDATGVGTQAAGNSAFREEIQKSKAMIAEADQAPAEPKSKGGRPSNEAKAAREAAEKAAQAEQLARIIPPAGLKQMAALPFGLAALHTGFDGFALSDEEADAIVPSLHVVLQTYAPQVKGESVAIMALASALFSIGVGKYLAFLKFRSGDGAENSAGGGSKPTISEAPPAPNSDPKFFPEGMHVT